MIRFSVKLKKKTPLCTCFGEWFGGETRVDTGGPVAQRIDYGSLD